MHAPTFNLLVYVYVETAFLKPLQLHMGMQCVLRTSFQTDALSDVISKTIQPRVTPRSKQQSLRHRFTDYDVTVRYLRYDIVGQQRRGYLSSANCVAN